MTDFPYDHHGEPAPEPQPRGRRQHRTEPGLDQGSSAHAVEITAEFWGDAPAWKTTGSTPVTRRVRDGGRRAQPARSERARPENAKPENTRPENAKPENARPENARPEYTRPEYVELEQVAREPFTAEPSARWALSAVDPLLVRLGAIVAVGVLLIPIALALRTSPEPDTIQTPRALATGGFNLGQTQPVPFDTRSPITTPPQSADDPVSDSSTAGQPGEVQAQQAVEPAISCALNYTIAAGDYWLRLVEESGVALSDLLAVNGATTNTPLYPGDEICLPAGASRPAPPTTVAPTTAAPTTAAPAASRPSASGASPAPTATTAPRPTTTAAPRPAAPATTAAPRPTTTAAPRPVASNESAAQVEAIIREVWPAELQDRAITIARRESGLRPGAYNGWCCYGVFQIYWNVHRGWLSGLGITSSGQLLDARTNITAAYAMYQRAGGWGPWSQTNY